MNQCQLVDLEAFAGLCVNVERVSHIPIDCFWRALFNIRTDPLAAEVLERKKKNRDSGVAERLYYAILDNNEVIPIGTTIEGNTVGQDLQEQRLKPAYIIESYWTRSTDDSILKLNEKFHYTFIYKLKEKDYDDYLDKLIADSASEPIKV